LTFQVKSSYHSKHNVTPQAEGNIRCLQLRRPVATKICIRDVVMPVRRVTVRIKRMPLLNSTRHLRKILHELKHRRCSNATCDWVHGRVSRSTPQPRLIDAVKLIKTEVKLIS